MGIILVLKILGKLPDRYIFSTNRPGTQTSLILQIIEILQSYFIIQNLSPRFTNPSSKVAEITFVCL